MQTPKKKEIKQNRTRIVTGEEKINEDREEKKFKYKTTDSKTKKGKKNQEPKPYSSMGSWDRNEKGEKWLSPFDEEGKRRGESGGEKVAVGDEDHRVHAIVQGQLVQQVHSGEHHLHQHHCRRRHQSSGNLTPISGSTSHGQHMQNRRRNRGKMGRQPISLYRERKRGIAEDEAFFTHTHRVPNEGAGINMRNYSW